MKGLNPLGMSEGSANDKGGRYKEKEASLWSPDSGVLLNV